MKLYLVRHGEPNPSDIDPKKHLSHKGIDDVKALGKKLKEHQVIPSKIYHSGITRAEETACYIADALGVSDVLRDNNLAPNDPVKLWGDLVESYSENIMLVGHMPYMTSLIEYLTAGDSTHFFNAPEVVCLERVEQGHWKLLWTLTPNH